MDPRLAAGLGHIALIAHTDALLPRLAGVVADTSISEDLRAKLVERVTPESGSR